jgi:hypothetical protein
MSCSSTLTDGGAREGKGLLPLKNDLIRTLNRVVVSAVLPLKHS